MYRFRSIASKMEKKLPSLREIAKVWDEMIQALLLLVFQGLLEFFHFKAFTWKVESVG